MDKCMKLGFVLSRSNQHVSRVDMTGRFIAIYLIDPFIVWAESQPETTSFIKTKYEYNTFHNDLFPLAKAEFVCKTIYVSSEWLFLRPRGFFLCYAFLQALVS